MPRRGLFDKAEKYLLDLGNAESERTASRVMAWRSLVAIYGQMGPERISDAKDAGEKAIELIKRPTQNPLLRSELTLVPYTLAVALAAESQYADSLHYLTVAERNARDLPCVGNRFEILALIQTEIAKILPLYPEGKDLVASRSDTSHRPCPGDQMAVLPTEQQPRGDDLAERRGAQDLPGAYQHAFHTVSIDSDAFGNIQIIGLDGQPPRILWPLGKDVFALRDIAGLYVNFQRDNDGYVTQLLLLQPNGAFVMLRK